jgi:Pvc16 N-terminal domain
MAGPNVVRDMGETLVALLQAALSGIVAPANVRIATPDSFHELEPTPQPTCTIFLYRVAVNSVMRNGPRVVLPGGATSRPLLPIDLSYLITPWGRDPRDEHLMLGNILQALYDRAELGAADLTGTSWAPDDTVQLVLETLTLEEHFCIWDTVDMPYRLSLTYMARIIGIAPADQIVAAPVVRSIFQAGAP